MYSYIRVYIHMYICIHECKYSTYFPNPEKNTTVDTVHTHTCTKTYTHACVKSHPQTLHKQTDTQTDAHTIIIAAAAPLIPRPLKNTTVDAAHTAMSKFSNVSCAVMLYYNMIYIHQNDICTSKYLSSKLTFENVCKAQPSLRGTHCHAKILKHQIYGDFAQGTYKLAQL